MRLGSTLLSRIVRSTSSHHRPRQIAMAVTLGALLGILPKTSLLFIIGALVCVFIPSHTILLLATAILVGAAVPLMHSTLGRIGLWSLTNPNLSVYWMRIDSMPLVPWLGLHNTVLNGSLIAWFVASIPLYIASRVMSQVLFAVSIPDEVAKIILAPDEVAKVSPVAENVEIRPLTGVRDPGPVQAQVEPPFVIWDDINHDQSFYDVDEDFESETGPTTAEQVARRSAEMAAWAEDLITEELLMDRQSGSSNFADVQSDSERSSTNLNVDEEERWLIETTMEMVRIAEQAVTNQAVMKAKLAGEAQDVVHTDSHTQESDQIQTAHSQNIKMGTEDGTMQPESKQLESNIRREQLPHTDHRSHLNQTRAPYSSSTNGVSNRPREEALHYLLRHLKGVQEKAQKQ